MFALLSERQAYTEVLEHEARKIVRLVRAFPAHGFERRHDDCGMSSFELAGGFVRHSRHLARHLSEAKDGEGGSGPRLQAPIETLPLGL